MYGHQMMAMPMQVRDIIDEPGYVCKFISILEKVDPNVSETGIVNSIRYYKLNDIRH